MDLGIIASATGGHESELILGVALAAITALLVVAYYVAIPYPIVMVVGGLALGFVPGFPELKLEPDVVLILFLPPLLYGAAFFSSLRDLRANLQPIASLSIGLVLTTMLAVGVIAHSAIDGLSWAAAFTLGAVLAPTDPVAATAIASRVGAPRRFVTVIEGESLINDATALILFKFAVVAAVAGTFSLPLAIGDFVVSSVGGVAIGIAVSVVIVGLRRRIDDPLTEIGISLLTPFLAYLPANAAGMSGVLAAVTAGIWLGWRAPELVTPSTRLQSNAVWEVFTFVLDTALFVLLGTQMPGLINAVADDYSTAQLVGYGVAVTLTVIGTRFVYMIVQRVIAARRASMLRGPAAPWNETLLLGFTGMRGAVSLAAALAIPAVTDAGGPFPQRDLIVLLVYVVILVTIVGQGLALGPLIRLLRFDDDISWSEREDRARVKSAKAAIRRVEELAGEGWVDDGTAARLKGLYDFRVRRFGARADDDDDGQVEERSQLYARLRREALQAERTELTRLHAIGFIPHDVLQTIERDLDLEEARLD